MVNTAINGDFIEILDREVRGNDSNTYISMPKQHKGRKVKVIVLND